MTRLEDIERLKVRTRNFALAILNLYAALPKSVEATILGKQLLRSGTSVGAQYREVIRAKSDADFISKIEGCLQELEETRYWLELIFALKLLDPNLFTKLDGEPNELIAIFTTIVKKVKSKT